MLARRDEFFHTTKVRGITYRKRRTPTNTQLLLYQLLSRSCQLKSQPDFPLICLMNISADKPATWHSSPEQCVVRERSRVLATVMHMCMHMYIQLQCSCCCYSIVNAFSYCLFTLLSPRTLCGGICVDYKQTKITCFLNIYVDTTRWRKMLL